VDEIGVFGDSGPIVDYSKVTPWSEEVEAVKGGGEGLAGQGEFVGESANTYAGGVGGAALVEAVAVGEK
jgi:hypothetical protein